MQECYSFPFFKPQNILPKHFFINLFQGKHQPMYHYWIFKYSQKFQKSYSLGSYKEEDVEK